MLRENCMEPKRDLDGYITDDEVARSIEIFSFDDSPFSKCWNRQEPVVVSLTLVSRV